jgi:biotin synthase
MDYHSLALSVLEGHAVSRDEALTMLRAPAGELDALLDGALVIRERHFRRDVRVHVLQNAKSGACPEDCTFCSQSVRYASPVQRYKTQTIDELLAGARAAYEAGAVTYCMVTATRHPSERDLDTLCEAVERIKAELPLRICTSLGLLTEAKAGRLAAAGVDRYNHNLESSQDFFPELVTTHDWSDRQATIRAARGAGMEACSGGILGMGERDEDRVDLALALRDLGVESVPVNLLDPRPGTPLGDREPMTAEDALRGLAMFRFVHPATEIRIAGGREAVLADRQADGLKAANSIFSGGYLTTPGQEASEDRKLLEAHGFRAVVIDELPPAIAGLGAPAHA